MRNNSRFLRNLRRTINKTACRKPKITILKIQSCQTFYLPLWRYPVKYSSSVKNRSGKDRSTEHNDTTGEQGEKPIAFSTRLHGVTRHMN